MKRSIAALLLVAVAGLVGWRLWSALSIDIHPSSLCGDGMVLQRDATAHIWGTAAKGKRVTVTFRDKAATAVTDDDGRWSAAIETGPAGGPFPMTIAGDRTLEYRNVLVGEVWLCGGQSNMNMPVVPGSSDAETAHSDPPDPLLRTFNVGLALATSAARDVQGKWIEANPKTVDEFSAVAYFFGRELRKRLGVPIGLIHSSHPGTRAEAWTPREILDGAPMFRDEHAKFDEVLRQRPKGQLDVNDPSVLYDGMIAPLRSAAIRGFLWYHGESNAPHAYRYRTLFPRLIESRRADWKLADAPFLFVQLAPAGPLASAPGENDWAELREAQTLALKLPNTAMAVMTDFGIEYDIHPPQKRAAGERLALAARAVAYGEKIEHSGPTFRSVRFDGGRAIVSFDHVAGGLVAKKLVPTMTRDRDDKGQPIGPYSAWRVDPDAKEPVLVGFTIAGKDRVFRVANAAIEGDSVIVSSKEVPEPIAVRYGWAGHPLCGLYNRADLPASPFRTDDFRLSTQRP